MEGEGGGSLGRKGEEECCVISGIQEGKNTEKKKEEIELEEIREERKGGKSHSKN